MLESIWVRLSRTDRICRKNRVNKWDWCRGSAGRVWTGGIRTTQPLGSRIMYGNPVRCHQENMRLIVACSRHDKMMLEPYVSLFRCGLSITFNVFSLFCVIFMLGNYDFIKHKNAFYMSNVYQVLHSLLYNALDICRNSTIQFRSNMPYLWMFICSIYWRHSSV